MRIAYAMRGGRLPLVYLPPFVSHLDLMWEAPAFRSFNEALARDFTLVRYDRYGCGLSDRDRTNFDFSVDLHVLEALADHLRFRRVALFGASDGGPFAIRYAVDHPRRVSHLILFGVGWQGGTSRVGAALNELMLADRRLGTNALADRLLPGADPDARAWFARIIREAASSEVQVGLSEGLGRDDLTDLLPQVRVPTLVIHRRDDRVLPLEAARELAARIPNARLAVLAGDYHMPEFGDAGSVIQAIRDFIGPSPGQHSLGCDAEDGAAGPLGLSARESKVLQLVAAGLSNRAIALRLSVSVHTVERHTVNIYTKLGVRGRAEATAYVLRRSLLLSNGAT